ncbi:Lsr2 family protein [Streptomyces sp. TRM66268-LWL]|uniref:Lsr2 family protein n=2 Tax=Streptomyces polyasparticus TaxID=2767826 RepID=A0ABR7SID2_9ACTN|nr:Lsr2 family protein [Streptomyces polyasparticus]
MGLPTDYKELVAAYGPGSFCDFLTLFLPGAPHESTDLTGPLPARLREWISQARRADPRPGPLPGPAEQLLVMAVTGNGDYLFWVAQPSDCPEDWTVAVNSRLEREWFPFDGGLAEFLLAVLNGTAAVPQFPADLLEHGAGFTPRTHRTPPSGTTPGPASGHRSMNLREVREWARANGYNLPDRGRIPSAVVEAWQRAHPDA